MRFLALFLALSWAVTANCADLTLRWQDNSDNEEGFVIERSTDGTNYIPVWQVPADVETWTDTDLLGLTEYWYRVKAFNAAGPSGYSNQASAVTKTDRDPTGPTLLNLTAPGQLTNISSRGLISVDAGQVIGGFVVEGDAIVVLIRAIGPTIGSPPFDVPNAIADPRLDLTYLDGTPIQSNDDWSGAAIENAASAVGAFPLQPGSKDAAILVNLSAGAYTVAVSGVDGATGIGLLEIYHVRP